MPLGALKSAVSALPSLFPSCDRPAIFCEQGSMMLPPASVDTLPFAILMTLVDPAIGK
jgi:hypothetical protein